MCRLTCNHLLGLTKPCGYLINFLTGIFYEPDWSEKMKTERSKNIAFAGIMLAVMAVLLSLEAGIYRVLVVIQPAFISIAFAISISIFDKSKMWYGGIILGVCSFALAFVFNPFFINPVISILPRVFMGVVAYYAYLFISKLTAKSSSAFLKDVFPFAVAGAVGALYNTLTVVPLLYAYYPKDLVKALSTILIFNAPIELICAAVIVPILARTFIKLNTKNQD